VVGIAVELGEGVWAVCVGGVGAETHFWGWLSMSCGYGNWCWG
jgi:hypothetical protein